MMLIDEISKLTNLSDEAIAFLKQKSEQVSFAKNEVVLDFNDHCNYLHFIRGNCNMI